MRTICNPRPFFAPPEWVTRALCSLMLGLNAFGAPAPHGGPSEGWRYLIVAETSRSMATKQHAALKALGELIASGMRGEARPGDSLGIWTFNTELRTGEFPLRQWTASNSSEIAENAVKFLKSRPPQQGARLDCAVEPLLQLAAGSAGLTVVLISTGQPIRGTPFDTELNTVTSRWKSYQDQKNLPFITVLRAQQGRFTDFAVTPLPWPLSWSWRPRQAKAIPETSTLPAETKRPRVVQSPKAATIPSLILSGRKSEPKEASPPAPPESSSPQHDPTIMPGNPLPLALNEAAPPHVLAEPEVALTPIIPQPEPPPPTQPAERLESARTKAGTAVENRPEPAVSEVPAGAQLSSVAAPQDPQTIQEVPVEAPPAAHRQPPHHAQVPASPLQPRASRTLDPGNAILSAPLARQPPPQRPESREQTKFQILAVTIGAGAFGGLLGVLRRIRGSRRSSIITQSIERQSGMMAQPCPTRVETPV